jgi:hypothetical protein
VGRHLALASSASPRRSRSTPGAPRGSPAGGSLPSAGVAFRDFAPMPDLRGYRHSSRDGVQGNRVNWVERSDLLRSHQGKHAAAQEVAPVQFDSLANRTDAGRRLVALGCRAQRLAASAERISQFDLT